MNPHDWRKVNLKCWTDSSWVRGDHFKYITITEMFTWCPSCMLYVYKLRENTLHHNFLVSARIK